MMSDVCKHCVQAGCLEVCPTGAIIRTEFDTVVIQQDVCNGCRDCIAGLPVRRDRDQRVTHVAEKCTLCYDRLQAGLTPACAQACPTAIIQFGPIDELRPARRASGSPPCKSAGRATSAYIYGDEDIPGRAELLLPAGGQAQRSTACRTAPKLPSRNVLPGSLLSIGSAAVVGLMGLLSFRGQRASEVRAATSRPEVGLMPPEYNPSWCRRTGAGGSSSTSSSAGSRRARISPPL